MTNWLQHPDIYKMSATIALINLVCLFVCLVYGNRSSVAYNAFFLIFNVLAAWGNYRARDRRISQAASQQLEQKQQHRQRLIELTVGTQA